MRGVTIGFPKLDKTRLRDVKTTGWAEVLFDLPSKQKVNV